MLLKKCVFFLRSEVALMEHGLELAQSCMQAMFKQVQSFIDMKQTTPMGPFLFVSLPEVYFVLAYNIDKLFNLKKMCFFFVSDWSRYKIF